MVKGSHLIELHVMCLIDLSFPLQMHLVLILQVVAFGIVLNNALSVEENFKSDSAVVQNSFEDPVTPLYTRGGSIQHDSPRLLTKARKLGYCLRRLSSMGEGKRFLNFMTT